MNSNMSGLPMGDNIVLHLHEFRRSGRVWKNRKNVLTTLFRNTSDESIQRVIQHFLPLSDPTSNPHQLRVCLFHENAKRLFDSAFFFLKRKYYICISSESPPIYYEPDLYFLLVQFCFFFNNYINKL